MEELPTPEEFEKLPKQQQRCLLFALGKMLFPDDPKYAGWEPPEDFLDDEGTNV